MRPIPAMPAGAATYNSLTGAAPIVIAQRGASGYQPEHTLAAYELAARLGADYIEPDVEARFAPPSGGYEAS